MPGFRAWTANMLSTITANGGLSGVAAPPVNVMSKVSPPGGFDVADRLPNAARTKLNQLRDSAIEARAVTSAYSDERNELIREIRERKGRIQQLKTPRGVGGYSLTDDDGEVISENTLLARAREKYDRIGRRTEQAGQIAQPIGLLVQRIERWIKTIPADAKIAEYKGPAAELRKGETAIEAVERSRRRLRELEADRSRIEHAPLPSGAVKKLMREQVETLSVAGRPNVMGLIEAGLEIAWSTTVPQNKVVELVGTPGFALDNREFINAHALLIWANKDAIIAALDREIDELSDDGAALDDATRAKKLKQTADDMLATERDEQGFIALAAEQGVPIAQRHDADPRAVLGLASDLPAAV